MHTILWDATIPEVALKNTSEATYFVLLYPTAVWTSGNRKNPNRIHDAA
jgi:hypothetical protein